jgi:hypothetical protein
MPIDPQDGGPDDWFVPASDGYPDDWFVPESDGYPDDWFVPASAAGTTQPPPNSQPGTANPALTTQPAPRPDPFAAFWASIPASRAGAMAWHPPIFLNSPGQSPRPAPAPLDAPWLGPTRGPLGTLVTLPGPNGPRYRLLGGIPTPVSASQTTLPSFQAGAPISSNSDPTVQSPIFSSLANLPGPFTPPLSDPTGDIAQQFPFPDGMALDARSPHAPPGLGAPLLNPQPENPSAIPLLQTAGSTSNNTDRSEQLSRLNVPGLNQSTPPTQSADEDNSGSNSPNGSQFDPDDSRSIIRVVRDSTGRALAVIHAQPVGSAPQTESDATPDTLHSGAKYAQINNAKTGNPVIDRTTDMLLAVLQQSVLALGAGWGARFGTAVHVDFANRVRSLDLPGIGQEGVEQGFHLDVKDFIRYGLQGSIRTDVTLRNPKDPDQRPIAVYDLKTGNAVLTARRVKEIFDKVGTPDLLVIELQYRTGDALDRTMIGPPR